MLILNESLKLPRVEPEPFARYPPLITNEGM